MLDNAKQRVYDILVDTDDNELIDRVIAFGLVLLIVVNVAAVVLETVDSVYQQYEAYFKYFEAFSLAVFSIEYLLRLWVAPMDPRYKGRFRGRLRYALTPMAIIDFLAIAPAFIPLFFAVDLRIIRALRIFRLFRLLKMSRYVESLNSLDDVVRAKKEELLVTTVMLLILLLFSGSLMYLVENEAQPDKFPDIPSALWWGIATLTTVGYGDVFPITSVGKVLGGMIAFLGIGMFALPTGILASGFAEAIQKKKREPQRSAECPHCGREISPGPKT
ncbi:MAG: ion transporter [Pyrinomonadaceae bacterium]